MDPRPTKRIRFVDFWPGFDPHDNWFTRLLERRYRLEHVERPDFLIYSCFGGLRPQHLGYDCVRIFYTGENRAPDWLTCDWAFTFAYTDHPRHFRLPFWVLKADPARLVKTSQDVDAILARKTKFCAFVVTNPLGRARNRFFRQLSRYARVDSGGKVFNNLGGRVPDKIPFLADYKFTIAFEHTAHPGYTTEKVAEPMLVDTIPIYWGDPLVGRDFDTSSFFAASDSPSFHDLIDRVIAVDRDPDLHRRMLERPWFVGNRIPPCADVQAILERFTTIFETPVEPVGQRRGLARTLRLHRIPSTLAYLRRRARRRFRKLTSNA